MPNRNMTWTYANKGEVGSLQLGGEAQLTILPQAGVDLDATGTKIADALNSYRGPLGVPGAAYLALSAPARRAEVKTALETVLRSLYAPLGTTDIADLCAHFLNIGQDKAAKTKLISDLVALAPHTPEAQRSGETFEQFGRTMRRWVWSPRE